MSDGKSPAIPEVEALERVLLVGLGNPGSRYTDTRHNVGFNVVEEIARAQDIALSSKRFSGHYGDGFMGSKRLALLLPQTYMNRSGPAVAKAQRYLSLARGGLVVIHDDVDLPLGKIRLKWAGSNGGHKGLKSIDAALGGTDYFRVRVGVGRPEFGSVTDHVLARLSSAERANMALVLEGATEAVRTLLREGLRPAQNQIHGRQFGQSADASAASET